MLSLPEAYSWHIALVLTGTVGLLVMWVTSFKQPQSTNAQRAWMGVFILLTLGSIVAAFVDHGVGEREKAEAVADRAASRKAMDGLRRSADDIARSSREARIQHLVEMKYMQGKMDAINVAIGLVLTNSATRQAATAALEKMVVPPAPPVASSVSAAVEELSNNELRAKALGLVAEIRDLTDTYREMSQTISQQHLHELEIAYQLKNMEKEHQRTMAAAKWAEIDKQIARLAKPDSFRWQTGLGKKSFDTDELRAGRAAASAAMAKSNADLDPQPADVNAVYVEKALRNLQRTINAFEAYHQSRAQLYRDKLSSRLPAGVANEQINYAQRPLSPSHIIAIADDLEKLSKLLPSV